MFQLIYVSMACEPFSQERLRRLLKTSRANNADKDVTGMLLYKNDSFMQALEGPEDDVRALYDRICEDERHENVRMLMAAPVDERSFPDWAMGFENVSELSPQEMPAGYVELAGKRFTNEAYTRDPDFAHQTLLGFKNRSFT